MVNVVSKQPLKVLKYGTSVPFIDVPLPQLDELKALLDANGVSYWVNEMAISLDGHNYTIVVDLGRDEEAKKVQAILDAAG